MTGFAHPRAVVLPADSKMGKRKGKGKGKTHEGPMTSMRVKDPNAQGIVLYDVPLEYMVSTQGLKEYMIAKKQRPCMCRLWLEGKCGQGANCKSFHVDLGFVSRARKANNIQFDEASFIREVLVRHTNGDVLAVKYTAVSKTKGLAAFREKVKEKVWEAVPLCTAHFSKEGCPAQRNCLGLHVKEEELKDYSERMQRTPCCNAHGDSDLHLAKYPGVVLIGEHQVPVTHIALTAGCRRLRPAMAVSEVCGMHVKSRCKFGRSCTRIHVCREWAEKIKLEVSLPERFTIPASSPPTPATSTTVTASDDTAVETESNSSSTGSGYHTPSCETPVCVPMPVVPLSIIPFAPLWSQPAYSMFTPTTTPSPISVHPLSAPVPCLRDSDELLEGGLPDRMTSIPALLDEDVEEYA